MKKYVIIFLATICVSCIYAKAQALVHPYLIMNMETEQNIRTNMGGLSQTND